MATRRDRKKTDIPIPEPRHRVGPKGVSSGISFRDLPPPSLDEIKKICEHYQTKCAGTYKSLASRYVYQMATEIDNLVDALKEEGYVTEETLSSMGDPRKFSDLSGESGDPRSRKRSSVKSRDRNSSAKMNASSSSRNPRRSRPRTASGVSQRPSHESYGRSTREFPCDSLDGLNDVDSPHRKSRHCSSRSRQRGNLGSLAHLNLEDQNEEVLRWLKEEMRRSQSLINRSRQLHDAELGNAKKEVEKVKRAAKLLIKAVHKKGKDKAAKSEANAESERRRRVKSQKMIESLIQSHSSQINLLKRGIRHSGSPSRGAKDFQDHGRFYPWGELEDDKTEEASFSLSDASDLTSILDDLAEEAYQQSRY